MDLCPCDIYTHSLAVMLRYYNIEPKYVVHAGAHDLIESDIYNYYGANVYAIECNPFVYQNLIYRLLGRDKQQPIYGCLWSEDGQIKPLYFYRNKTDGAGGLYLPDKMLDYIPDCPPTGETFNCITTTFDRLARVYHIPTDQIDFLNVDLQGAELEFFKGAQALLTSPSLQNIWCEVSWDAIYKGGPQLQDITKYLAQYGFKHIITRVDSPKHGDALYSREIERTI